MHFHDGIVVDERVASGAAIMRKNGIQDRIEITHGSGVNFRIRGFPRFVPFRDHHFDSFRPGLRTQIIELHACEEGSSFSEFQPGNRYLFPIERQRDATLLFLDEILKVFVVPGDKRRM